MSRRLVLYLILLVVSLGLGRGARAQQGPFVDAAVEGASSNGLLVVDTSTNAVSTISLPFLPAFVAMTGDESFAYAAGGAGDSGVDVINTATNQLSTISVGTNPQSIAVSPNGKTVYVGNYYDGTVSVINAATNTVTATIPVQGVSIGGGPVAISPDGSTVYVGAINSNTITTVNTATNTVASTFTSADSGITDIAVTPDGSALYVLSQGNSSVTVISATTHAVLAHIALSSTPGTSIVISPNGQTAYVGLLFSDEIVPISTTSFTVGAAIPTTNVAPNTLAISPDGESLYAGSYYSEAVVGINLSTGVNTTLASGATFFSLGVCSDGNGLLASGSTFVANTSGALACTEASGPTGSPGPVFTGGTMQFAGANISSSLPIQLQSAGGTFDTDGNNATLSGAITGPGGLTKIGAGILTLAGPGSYSGPTAVEVGTLQAGSAEVFSPNSDYAVASGATLDLNNFNQTVGSLAGAGSVTLGAATLTTGADNAGSADFSGDLSGAGGLIKIGTGEQTLSGTNDYAGATDVQGGVLLADGSLASSGVTVENGATLGGSGTIANAVSVANGGILSPSAGGAPATLTVGSLALNSGSMLDYELGTANVIGGATNDLTNVAAGLTLAGSVNVTNSGSFGLGAYRLINYGGALADNGLTIGSLPNSYSGLIQTTIPGQVNLVVTGPGALVQYWDGATTNGDGAIHGGSGAWDATTTNWTAPNGAINASWQSGFGIFAGAPGTVTVAAPLSYQGLQFSTDGYVVTEANGGSLAPSGQAPIRVDTGVTATISAPIEGSGGLEKTDPGTLILSGANAYSGGTSVMDGTLGLGSNSALGSGALTMGAGTALRAQAAGLTIGAAVSLDGLSTIDTQANDLTLSGVLSDGASAGGFTKIGSGALTLTGSNAFSGGVTIADGTLVGSIASLGSGAIADDAELVFDQTTDGAFAAPISGSGSLAKQGGGTLTLTGSDPLTGATDVQDGTLIVDGALSSPVTIENGATLGGFGAITGLTVHSGATAAPGLATPYSTLTVAGDASFAAGSTYAVNVNAAGQTDSLSATGAATLSGGTLAVTAAPGAYSPASRFVLLTAAGGVSGAFAQLSDPSLALTFAFLSPVLTYNPDDVVLGFAQTAPFTSAASTRNQQAVAATLQNLGSGAPLYTDVVGLNAAAARQAFDALSGEIHADVATAAIEDSRLPREAILDRLSAPYASAPTAGSTQALYAPNRSAGGGPGFAPAPGGAAPAQAFGLWGQGFGDYGVNRSDGDAATLTRATGGFIVGADATALGVAGGDWRFGLAGGYTDDLVSAPQRQSTAALETAFGALYVGARFGAVDLRLGAIDGFSTAALNRQIVFPGFGATATSNDRGSTGQIFGETGYRFDFSSATLRPLGLSAATLEPIFSAAGVDARADAFDESAGIAALNGFAHSDDVAITTLGLRAQTTLAGSLPLVLRGLIGWRHVFGALTPTALLGFPGATQPFTIVGAPIDRDALGAEAGLSYALAANVTLGVSYSGQYGPHATDNAVRGDFDLRF